MQIHFVRYPYSFFTNILMHSAKNICTLPTCKAYLYLVEIRILHCRKILLSLFDKQLCLSGVTYFKKDNLTLTKSKLDFLVESICIISTQAHFGTNSLSRIEVTQIVEAILVLESKIQVLRGGGAAPKPFAATQPNPDTSCYGSYNTSPTPSTAAAGAAVAGAVTTAAGAHSHPDAKLSADFDSGCCLGSDRSCGNRTKADAHATHSRKIYHQRGGPLSNVEEER